MKRFVFIIICAACLLPMAAQPDHRVFGQEHHVRTPHKPMTAEERAKATVGRMQKELGLDDRQCEKLYKIWLKEEQAIDQNRMAGPMMPPPSGEAGRRPSGDPGMGEPSDRIDVYSEEYIAKREKKLKKILKDKYQVWRSQHPAGPTELPPVSFSFRPGNTDTTVGHLHDKRYNRRT